MPGSDTSKKEFLLPQSLEFCHKILPKVSRTFAINIRVLEGELQRAVLVAYLFCRIVDTVEDTFGFDGETRVRLLERYAFFFRRKEYDEDAVREWLEHWGKLDTAQPEQKLVGGIRSVFRVYDSLPIKVRETISKCVVEMADGMKWTIEHSADDGRLRSLHSMADLERYCYYVAGTVGSMLTRLFTAEVKEMSRALTERAEQLEQSFALGLQITNIIKDSRSDYERGWCYLPRELAARYGVPIEGLFATRNQKAVLSAFNELIQIAAQYLDNALDYTLIFPRHEEQIRLFNLWSLFFAIKTLRRAWNNPDLLRLDRPVKIPRWEVYRTLAHTKRSVRDDASLRASYHRIRRAIPSL